MNSTPNPALRYAALATQWLVMLLIAVWAGHKIDQKITFRIPLFLILLPLISLIVSFFKLMKELNKK